MRSFLLLLALLLLRMVVFAQQPLPSSNRKAYRDSIPAQPALSKDSRGVQGFIYDKGNGRKEFRRADSLLAVNRSALMPAHKLIRQPAKPTSTVPANPAGNAPLNPAGSVPAKPASTKGSVNLAN